MTFDWDHLKPMIACAEAGSLSAAAATLRISQPTLGRKIDALEAELGVQLFTRSPRGMTLTASGRDLLTHAREVEAAAARLSLAAAGKGDSVDGTVRITTSSVLAAFHLPTILTRITAAEPGVQIELVASDTTDNLMLREADIAVRMYLPNQPGLITRKVTEIETGLFASHRYLVGKSVPTLDNLGQHQMVGYDRNPVMRDYLKTRRIAATDEMFRLRTDDQIANWQLVVAGGGIGVMQAAIGQAEPLVTSVLPEIAMPSLPVWLTTHEELRTNRLIRRIFDMLIEDLAKLK